MVTRRKNSRIRLGSGHGSGPEEVFIRESEQFVRNGANQSRVHVRAHRQAVRDSGIWRLKWSGVGLLLLFVCCLLVWLDDDLSVRFWHAAPIRRLSAATSYVNDPDVLAELQLPEIHPFNPFRHASATFAVFEKILDDPRHDKWGGIGKAAYSDVTKLLVWVEREKGWANEEDLMSEARLAYDDIHQFDQRLFSFSAEMAYLKGKTYHFFVNVKGAAEDVRREFAGESIPSQNRWNVLQRFTSANDDPAMAFAKEFVKYASDFWPMIHKQVEQLQIFGERLVSFRGHVTPFQNGLGKEIVGRQEACKKRVEASWYYYFLSKVGASQHACIDCCNAPSVSDLTVLNLAARVTLLKNHADSILIKLENARITWRDLEYGVRWMQGQIEQSPRQIRLELNNVDAEVTALLESFENMQRKYRPSKDLKSESVPLSKSIVMEAQSRS